MTPEDIREFEKAGKSIARLKGSEILFQDDCTGRMKYAFHAMEGDEQALRQSIHDILNTTDGPKHLVRALNNLSAIGHHGALCFAKVIFEAITPTYTPEEAHQKLIQILDAVSPALRNGLGWLDQHVILALDQKTFSREALATLWIHWCAAQLRACHDAGNFIQNVGSRRPQNLQKSLIHSLAQAVENPNTPWDIRSASLYLLLGNHLIPIENAREFADDAYAAFPLEALEGVEILSIAIEHDTAKLAEYESIAAKLAQLRRENLILKDMELPAFVDASQELFRLQNTLPSSPLEIALNLQDMPKNQRLIASALIDDIRLAEWLKLASKNTNVLRELTRTFLQHFQPQNPVLRNFCTPLLEAAVNVANADAKSAERLIAYIEILPLDLTDLPPEHADAIDSARRNCLASL